MYVVRDNRRDGVAVAWGTDWDRLNAIASLDPDLELWPDLNGPAYYWHVERDSLNWVHPYDLDAREHAEIV